MAIAAQWKQYLPDNSGNAKRLSPEEWKEWEYTIHLMHHEGRSKRQILEDILNNKNVGRNQTLP
jgi:hypothetical protein